EAGVAAVLARRALADAVDVVAGPVAVQRAVGLPPAAGNGPGRAGVDAVIDRAAELGVPVGVAEGTGRTAPLRRSADDQLVGRPRAEDIAEGRSRQRRACDRGAHEEAAPARAGVEPPGRP